MIVINKIFIYMDFHKNLHGVGLLGHLVYAIQPICTIYLVVYLQFSDLHNHKKFFYHLTFLIYVKRLE